MAFPHRNYMQINNHYCCSKFTELVQNGTVQEVLIGKESVYIAELIKKKTVKSIIPLIKLETVTVESDEVQLKHCPYCDSLLR